MIRCADELVSEADVERVYSAWERERHHSAERHLYPEIISSLQRIKEEHPNVIIGAVTDGKANPMSMVFTLAPYFDFCTSWEDGSGIWTDRQGEILRGKCGCGALMEYGVAGGNFR